MILGTVVGRVWSDRQLDGLQGMRHLLVRGMDPGGAEHVAVDLLGVGTGVTVLVATEEAAAAAAGVALVDAAIVGLVSEYERPPADAPVQSRGEQPRTEVT